MRPIYLVIRNLLLSRWLIDHGKDHEGKRVIADLHGGDLDNPVAVSEYEEIREKVREDVSHFHYSSLHS
jgi:hypothetical protein